MGILAAIIGIAVVMLVLGRVIPVIWPMITATSDNISAMTGADAGTVTIQSFWPLILLMIGLGIGVAIIMYAVKKFGLFTGR